MSKRIIRAFLIACAAAPLLHANDDGLWRPAPPKETHPYPRLAPRDPRPPARLTTMTIDGTFGSYKTGAPVIQTLDSEGKGTFFGAGTFQQQGPDGGACILVPGGNGPTIGFEEKNIPLKPNRWYRVEYMMKGVPFKMQFSYPRVAPTPDGGGEDHKNFIIMDNSFGGGYGYCYVCAECQFVKVGTNEEGSWITFGFRELPDTCPGCGAKDSLYNEGDRQFYKDWTLVYHDFRVNDYVGHFHNVPYYWVLVIIGSGSDNRIANLMVYEITEEGGEAVGGDLVVDIPASDPLAPPRVSALEIAFGPTPDNTMRAASAEFQKARRLVAAEKGILVPPARILKRPEMEDGAASILINGQTVWSGRAGPAALGGALANALRANAHRLLTLDDTALLADAARKAGKKMDKPLPEIHNALLAILASGGSILPFPELP